MDSQPPLSICSLLLLSESTFAGSFFPPDLPLLESATHHQLFITVGFIPLSTFPSFLYLSFLLLAASKLEASSTSSHTSTSSHAYLFVKWTSSCVAHSCSHQEINPATAYLYIPCQFTISIIGDQVDQRVGSFAGSRPQRLQEFPLAITGRLTMQFTPHLPHSPVCCWCFGRRPFERQRSRTAAAQPQHNSSGNSLWSLPVG